MPSKPTVLVDTATGSEFRRADIGDAIVTIETTTHPYRTLLGAAFVTLTADTVAYLDDDKWEPVLGSLMFLPGGCEVDVNNGVIEQALEDIEECGEDLEEMAGVCPGLVMISPNPRAPGRLLMLVPFIINDADLPPARVLIPIDTVTRMQRITRGTGVHARGGSPGGAETACRHLGADLGTKGCRGCYRRIWTDRARKLGVIDG